MKIAAVGFGTLLVATMAVAGPPQIENVQLETSILSGSLSSVVKSWAASAKEASWLGWHVPIAEGDHVLCCWSRGDRRSQSQSCKLEGSHRHFVFSSDSPPTFLSENLVILLRTEKGRLDELQVYSDGCRLDAGGRELIWLEDVDPDQSAAFVAELAEAKEGVGDEALMALALHGTPLAADKLADLARRHADSDLRGEALFWLSHTGTAHATKTILEALEKDPDPDVREEAIFALSLLPESQGLPLLLAIVQDRSQPAAVRQEAFFWFVQSGDDEALDLISEILSN